MVERIKLYSERAERFREIAENLGYEPDNPEVFERWSVPPSDGAYPRCERHGIAPVPPITTVREYRAVSSPPCGSTVSFRQGRPL